MVNSFTNSWRLQSIFNQMLFVNALFRAILFFLKFKCIRWLANVQNPAAVLAVRSRKKGGQDSGGSSYRSAGGFSDR